MGGKYSTIQDGLNVNNLNNGDIVLIRNKKYPSTGVQRFIADRNRSLWHSVGVVLLLPEMTAKKYLFEISEFHPHDNLIDLLSGRSCPSGVRVVPLAERLSGVKSGSVCGIRKMESNMRPVESLRQNQHFQVMRALSRTMRPQAERVTDQAAAVTWILQTLGVILNPKYKLSISDLRGSYLNKITQSGVHYESLDLINID